MRILMSNSAVGLLLLLLNIYVFYHFNLNEDNHVSNNYELFDTAKILAKHNNLNINELTESKLFTSETTSALLEIKRKEANQEVLFKQTLTQLEESTKSCSGDNSYINQLRFLENSKFAHVDTLPISISLPELLTDETFPITRINSISDSMDDSLKIFSEKNTNNAKEQKLSHIGYWQTVHSIESKQGKLLYRPRNKSRSCSFTTSPCGHHQLTVQALKDIGCNSLQCRKDRLDYQKSLKLSKKLLALNEKRLRKNGISKLEDYQKYLIHQQGAFGIKSIIAADQGKKVLSKKLIKNMANNSPYSYRHLKRLGSKFAANKFLQHWKKKWLSEKRLIAGIKKKPTDSLKNELFIPTFSDNEITLALNYKF